MSELTELAEAMRSLHAVALTGAGASTESGLPDFRGPEGLWKGADPARVASLTALRKTPLEFYQFYRYRLASLGDAHPGPPHTAMARLQQIRRLGAIITQNIDGLHQAAGSSRVIELHGSLRHASCLECGRRHPAALLNRELSDLADLPRCSECGGLIKPGVVLFEELLPEAAYIEADLESRQCELFVVVGTSLTVSPANWLPEIALETGAKIAIINREPTPLDHRAHWRIWGTAGDALQSLVALLERS